VEQASLQNFISSVIRVDIRAGYRIFSAQKHGTPAGLPPRSPVGALEGGLIGGVRGNFWAFGGRHSKRNSCHSIEGLAQGGKLHPLQEAFLKEGAVQCGFCIPGILMPLKALLDNNPAPTREEEKVAMAGNLCRCTGYSKIFKAVDSATHPA
jgi:hypothetical protein